MYSGRNNLIIGFHGCDESVCHSLLNHPEKIEKSEKPYDWLGHGMYFWENNYDRALEWAKDKAKRHEIESPAVIGAILSLDYCFDLLDTRYIKMIQVYHSLMVDSYTVLDREIPINKDPKTDLHKDKILRYLDCAVIEFMHDKISDQISKNKTSTLKQFDSTRGVFTEGGPAFKGAGIMLKSHIQICIRNQNCIKGFFLPRKPIDF